MVERKSICILTPGHISYCPRAVKEADALSETGYRVRVVSINREKDKWQLDQELVANRRWQLEVYPAQRQTAWFKAGLRQRIASYVAGYGVLREYAFSRYFPELRRLAATEPADLYIAHMLPALPAAAAAAKMHGAKVGFDAEDFHRGELRSSDSSAVRLVEWMEERYIPQCDYITAASDGIGREYAAVLGIPTPTTILNVFPLAERSGHTPPAELLQERKGDGLSLYWYSQVIGPGRGLEDALQATARLKPQVQLHLRGGWAHGYRNAFEKDVQSLGIAEQVHILAPVPPDQLVERAAQHDVGLALETGENRNRQLTVTNKLFVYLLAGLAVAATDVPSQAAILQDAGSVGFTYPFGHVEELVNGLTRWLNCPDELHNANQQALLSATNRFNWELEATKLVQFVGRVLA